MLNFITLLRLNFITFEFLNPSLPKLKKERTEYYGTEISILP
jgi:hypothetical protein